MNFLPQILPHSRFQFLKLQRTSRSFSIQLPLSNFHMETQHAQLIKQTFMCTNFTKYSSPYTQMYHNCQTTPPNLMSAQILPKTFSNRTIVLPKMAIWLCITNHQTRMFIKQDEMEKCSSWQTLNPERWKNMLNHKTGQVIVAVKWKKCKSVEQSPQSD